MLRSRSQPVDIAVGLGGGLICALRHEEPGAAQQYISLSPGPSATTSASPSERTKIEAAENVFLVTAIWVLRQPEPGAAQ